MKFERYLLAVTNALRNDVLPALPPSPARDQIINSLRVLTRVAIGMAETSTDAHAAAADARLPSTIRAAFASGANDTPRLAEEVAVDASTSRGMAAASDWLANTSWCDDPAQAQVARALLEWEGKWRDTRLAQMTAAEISDRNLAASISSGSNLSEATLLEYLRNKLANPDLSIDGYRLLPGGRTRKTVMFKQTGHEEWPQWLVVQCDPPVGYHSFPGVVSQYPVLEYVYQKGIRAPRPLLMELDPAPFGTPFMIVESMPGSPPSAGINFFAPPPPSEKLALSLAQQMGRLHSLSIDPVAKAIPNLLPGEAGWPGDLDNLIATISERFHGPSLAVSAALAWMRRNVHCVNSTITLVHGDMLQQNLLADNEAVTAVLDWESIRVGHPGEDLGYVRPMIEQMVSWDRFMEAYFASGGPRFSASEADYFTLRAYILMLTHIAGSRNAFEEGRVDDIRAAEVGCSLAPLFVNCVAQTLDKVLAREAKVICC